MSQLDQARQLNPFLQSKTIFSGADPAIAQLEGGAGIIQGTDPSSHVAAVLASWSQSGQGGGSATEASEQDPANAPGSPQTDDSLLGRGQTVAGVKVPAAAKLALLVLSVGLVLLGAWALIGSPTPTPVPA